MNWVPSRREYTLYMRPFMFASEPFLGVRAPQEVDYCVIRLPSGRTSGRREAGQHLG